MVIGLVLGTIALGQAASEGFGQQFDQARFYAVLHLLSTIVFLVGIYLASMKRVTQNTRQSRSMQKYRTLFVLLSLIIISFDIWLVVAMFF